MSVRQTLLAILVQGPCYGYQLRHEFDRRTGSVWPLNVGQIYNTLERLERDGLVQRGAADAQGHVYWEITTAGADEVDRWLLAPVARSTVARDELTIKISVAATLPGADAGEIIDRQREESTSRLRALLARRTSHVDADAEGLARSLVLDSLIFAAEAELRWLDHVRTRLAEHPRHALALELDPERPRRGRPARIAGSVLVV
ncbi:PadR family transcriptional regulator [Microbacterium sp. GCS4]|uniref:PadR family transcriptional regulator n=1 Tax=Microbacterium sp. GCS4 TaxID=1692239 RepID=UPI000681B312|nr:helix-turn-helix transcriptional regulator [Microbacterium sp. GCS4]KNY07412.1 transcriptional regulator [Microbacterium sp. GCS4]